MTLWTSSLYIQKSLPNQGRLKVKYITAAVKVTCQVLSLLKDMQMSSLLQSNIMFSSKVKFQGNSSVLLIKSLSIVKVTWSFKGRLKVTNTSSAFVSGWGKPPIVIIILDQKIDHEDHQNRWIVQAGWARWKTWQQQLEPMAWPEDGRTVGFSRIIVDTAIVKASAVYTHSVGTEQNIFICQNSVAYV